VRDGYAVAAIRVAMRFREAAGVAGQRRRRAGMRVGMRNRAGLHVAVVQLLQLGQVATGFGAYAATRRWAVRGRGRGMPGRSSPRA
jgi:hypothetical protein